MKLTGKDKEMLSHVVEFIKGATTPEDKVLLSVLAQRDALHRALADVRKAVAAGFDRGTVLSIIDDGVQVAQDVALKALE